VPVGAELQALGWPRRPAGPPATVEEEGRPAAGALPPEAEGRGAEEKGEEEGRGGSSGGSIMIILATDLPLTARQLTRVARRAALGLARTGSVGAHGSGDFILAFSTADPEPAYPAEPVLTARRLAEDDRHFGPIFRAAVEATEEAVVNSLFAARTVVGRDGHVREAIPVETVLEILERHGRLGRSG
jgi:D-aminopeptidase